MPPSETFRPLSPSDFTFHGFDDVMADVAQSLQDIGIRGGPLTTETVEDALFVPSMRLPAAYKEPGRFAHEGSLLDRDGRPIELAQARRRTLRWGPLVRGDAVEQVLDRAAVAPDREIAEEVVYLGWLFEHYGHFLTESLSRTWFLDRVDPSVKVVFHRKRDYAPSGTTQRVLEAFGVPPGRILWLDQPTRLRRVVVPEPSYELHWTVHEQTLRGFRDVALRIADGAQPSGQPLYLSRRLLPSHLRQLVGEFELEEALRENGFRVAYPETMAFEDQVRLVNQHRHIFTSAGSAAYNALFARHRPTLHFLTAGVPRQDYFLLPALLEAPAAYCHCLVGGGRPPTKTTPYLIDLDQIFAYLEEGGWLTKPLRAALARRDARLQERFDEAWFCDTVSDLAKGEALDAALEQEALALARGSWPLSLTLAKHYSTRDPSRVDALVRQFAALAAAEPDVGRLASHHAAAVQVAGRLVKHCQDLSPDTKDHLTSVLQEQFLVDVPTRVGRKGSPRVATTTEDARAKPKHARAARSRAVVAGWTPSANGAQPDQLPESAPIWSDNPIVIGATGGSGTRVLAQILEQAGVFIGADLNRALDAKPLTVFFDLWINLYAARDTVLNQDEAECLLAPMARSLTTALTDHWSGADAAGRVWGWKAGRSIYLLPFLHSRFPRLRFVHLVRDGRDMAFSDNQAQLSKHGPTFLDQAERQFGVPIQSIILWNRVNLAAAAYGERELHDQYLRIRFEDLCTDPQAAVGRLLEFGGLAGDVQELAALVQPPATIGRWREQRPRLAQQVQRFGKKGLRRFGYERGEESTEREEASALTAFER